MVTFSRFKRPLMGALVLLVLCALAFFGARLWEHLPQLKQWADQLSPNALSVSIFYLGYTLGGVCFFPIPIMAFLVGVVFGPWWGAVIVISGSLLAAATGFFAGRFVDVSAWGSRPAAWVRSIQQLLELKGVWILFALRIAPAPPFAFTSMASAALGIPFFRYLVASSLGILPLNLATLILGHQAIRLLRRPEAVSTLAIAALVILFFSWKLAQKMCAPNSVED